MSDKKFKLAIVISIVSLLFSLGSLIVDIII